MLWGLPKEETIWQNNQFPAKSWLPGRLRLGSWITGGLQQLPVTSGYEVPPGLAPFGAAKVSGCEPDTQNWRLDPVLDMKSGLVRTTKKNVLKAEHRDCGQMRFTGAVLIALLAASR